MDRSGYLSLCGFTVGIALISFNLETSPSIVRPSYSAAVFLALSGLTLLALCSYNSSIFATPKHHQEVELELSSLNGGPRRARTGSIPSRYRQWRLSSFFLILCIFLRVELFRRVVSGTQCSTLNVELLLPLGVALLQGLGGPQHDSNNGGDQSPHAQSSYSRSSLLSAFLIACSGMLKSVVLSPSRSSYICSTSAASGVVLSQYGGVFLDAIVVHFGYQLLRQGALSTPSSSRLATPLASVLIGASASLIFFGTFLFAAYPTKRQWLLEVPAGLWTSLITPGFVLVFTLICSLHLALRLSSASVVIIAVFSWTCMQLVIESWTIQAFAPYHSNTSMLFFLALLNLAMYLIYTAEFGPYSTSARTSKSSNFPARPPVLLCLLGLFLVQGYLFTRNVSLATHPVSTLITNARSLHEAWLLQAGASRSLEDAVNEYTKRHGRLPPPGFDKWYNFTVTRNSIVIDDFDSIYHDLLPFWSVSPAELRHRTWEVTANKYNDVFPIMIRSGKTDLGPNRLPTHRWMLEGFASFLENFVEYIPDMDLALNPNDECRVAIPWEALQEMQSAAKKTEKIKDTKDELWSRDRAVQWLSPDVEDTGATSFRDYSFSPSYPHLAKTCPPSSKARNDFRWNTRDLCESCAAPHSYGLFVSNWTLAADACHQPDLANLHGFFISPAAYRITTELIPIFSQSKVPGYNDILYPSPWNYMGKVKYSPTEEQNDPHFPSKNPTLFWRGATSEGVSNFGAWQGMARQRFVYATNDTHSQALTPLLITDDTDSQTTTNPPVLLTNIPVSHASLPATDTGIVDSIARCVDADCIDEAHDLGLTSGVDFQTHWNYKYLMDLDGGGFSGRFIPFLKSRSLPFKAALFREWYDSRLTAWLHFVPQDLRLQGLYSTLAYFAGMQAKNVGGVRVKMTAHEEEASKIAEEGREWAHKALRKEDMEIYMFRLLLEWARLTDDRRDELGFKV